MTVVNKAFFLGSYTLNIYAGAASDSITGTGTLNVTFSGNALGGKTFNIHGGKIHAKCTDTDHSGINASSTLRVFGGMWLQKERMESI